MLALRDGFVALGVALALAACGESKSDTSDDDENGGASGGTSGTGGNAGAAEGGSSGTASGGTSAGSAGTGGSASGGGGTNGSSGSSVGGASGSGASGGMGGTAGRGYRPPDNQLMGCRELCELERAAMCTGETTFEKCIEGCHLGILFEVCSDLADEQFACVDGVDSAECSASGEAVIPECAVPKREVDDCIVTDGFTDDLAEPCGSFCTASAAAMCPNTSYESCSYWCLVVSSAFPVCAPTFEPFLNCGADAEQACNADGEAEAPSCEAAFESFLACLDADYAWQPHLGIVR